MNVTKNLDVKGTRYYEAPALFRKGRLSSGLSIRLEHQPNNRYDSNAVAVLVNNTGTMLGHVSRNLAPAYAKLVDSGRIVDAALEDVSESGGYINIVIRVTYQPFEEVEQKNKALLWQSSLTMPVSPGVYAIRNTQTGRQYIGSSKNMQARIQSHFRNLSSGSHVNHVLQSDFLSLGAGHFEARVLIKDIAITSLASTESDYIASLLGEGMSLYNLTEDGQGLEFKPNGRSKSEPVSERLLKERAAEEQRRLDSLCAEESEKIRKTFEHCFEGLLPFKSFWDYFFATFIGIIIIVDNVIKHNLSSDLYILSAVCSFPIAHCIKRYIEEKVRQSPAYRKLQEDMHEKLAAISMQGHRDRA